VRDQLPHLKAIVQYKDELEQKLPNLYTVRFCQILYKTAKCVTWFSVQNIQMHAGGLLIITSMHMKSSDAKASKCHLKFSSRRIIFIKLVYLSSVISLK